MSEETNDLTLLSTFELLHALARESAALQKAVETELLQTGKDDLNVVSSHSSLHADARSFYRDLEWRLSQNQLSLTQITRALNLIIREVNFFRVIIQNLLGSLARKQPLTLDKKRVKLIPLVEEVLDLFDFSAANKGVELRRRLKGDPTLYIDREMFHRVLVNLIDNAIKYSFSGTDGTGRRFVMITSQRHSVQGDWMISVASYGVGIDESEISSGYIFEYGTRGKFASDRGRGGTGIGLAEAKRIIEAHQGKIHIESQNQGGNVYLTTVKVVLPHN